MSRTDDVYTLPADLPVPEDDGACDHLSGKSLPSIGLRSTRGALADLSKLAGGIVVYTCPRMGRRDQGLPAGWNSIPGARGCTPQSCAFRDHRAELASLGTRVFGPGTRSTDYRKELAERLHLPFDVPSDREIEKVFYPDFPPDKGTDDVIDWLKTHPD